MTLNGITGEEGRDMTVCCGISSGPFMRGLTDLLGGYDPNSHIAPSSPIWNYGRARAADQEAGCGTIRRRTGYIQVPYRPEFEDYPVLRKGQNQEDQRCSVSPLRIPVNLTDGELTFVQLLHTSFPTIR